MGITGGGDSFMNPITMSNNSLSILFSLILSSIFWCIGQTPFLVKFTGRQVTCFQTPLFQHSSETFLSITFEHLEAPKHHSLEYLHLPTVNKKHIAIDWLDEESSEDRSIINQSSEFEDNQPEFPSRDLTDKPPSETYYSSRSFIKELFQAILLPRKRLRAKRDLPILHQTFMLYSCPLY